MGNHTDQGTKKGTCAASLGSFGARLSGRSHEMTARHGYLLLVTHSIIAMQIVQSTAGQKSSAELTLLLYGWDGQDTKLSSLLLGLPYQDSKWTIAKQSTRLVGRATSMLAPRTTPPRSSRLSRQSAGMNFDDASSSMSLPQMSATLNVT